MTERPRSSRTSVIQNPERLVMAPKFIMVVPKSIVTLPRNGSFGVTIGTPFTKSEKDRGQHVLSDECALVARDDDRIDVIAFREVFACPSCDTRPSNKWQSEDLPLALENDRNDRTVGLPQYEHFAMHVLVAAATIRQLRTSNRFIGIVIIWLSRKSPGILVTSVGLPAHYNCWCHPEFDDATRLILDSKKQQSSYLPVCILSSALVVAPHDK